MIYQITENDRTAICEAADLLAKIYQGHWNQERHEDVEKARQHCMALLSIVPDPIATTTDIL